MRRIVEAQCWSYEECCCACLRDGSKDRNKSARVEIDQDYCCSGGDLFAAATSTPGKAIAPPVRSSKEKLAA